jgi:hypothetical protein
MEDQLRNILKDKVGSLSVKDIAPAFNSSHTWNELSARLEKKERKLVPVLWAYAAALVLGFFIGGSVIYYSLRSGSEVVVQSKQVLRQTPVTNQMSGEQVARNDQNAISVLQPPTKRKRSVKQSGQVASKVPTDQPLRIPAQTSSVIVAESVSTQTGVAVKAASKPRAIHLLDVEGEDRMVLINESQETKKSVLQVYFSPNRVARQDNTQAPASVLEFITR